MRRVVRWVDAVRKGKADRKTINIPAEFIPGGSIGPVWKRGGAAWQFTHFPETQEEQGSR